MSERKVKQVARSISDMIEQFGTELNGIRTSETYSTEYLHELTDKKTSEFKTNVTLKLIDFEFEVETLRRELKRKRNDFTRVYRPVLDSEKIVYHHEKDDFIKQLKTKRCAEILEDYREYVELGTGFEKIIQMYEDSAYPVMFQLNEDVARAFEREVRRNIESRIPDELKETESRTKEFDSLYRTSKRIQNAFTNSNRLPVPDLYVFIALTKSIDTVERTRMDAVAFKRTFDSAVSLGENMR